MDNFINKYIVGDNLDVINKLPDEYIDFSYIDPPFYKRRNFGDFDDRWPDINNFCYEFMKPRIELIKLKLKKNGSLLVHLDESSSHYIKVMIDSVFGYNNFRNEIIWRTGGHSKTTKKLYKAHDNLLVYSKSNKYTFNPIYLQYNEEYLRKNNVQFCEHHKKYYITCAIHHSQPDVVPRPTLRYEWNGHNKQWLVTKKKLEELDKDNRLQYNEHGIPRIKRFLDEMEGLPLTDVWDNISSIQANEKLDYATQKPIQLLGRIITLYTNEGDIVLDPFAGSGTTGRACIKLNRQYILIDTKKKGKMLFENNKPENLFFGF